MVCLSTQCDRLRELTQIITWTHFATYTMRQVLFQIIWWYLQNVHIAYVNKYSGRKYKYKYKYFKSVLEYYSSTSTSTKYYISET